MTRILSLIVCLLILRPTNSFSQISESAVIPYTKNANLTSLGGSNGYIFFYATELHREVIRITIYKFKADNLELVESKDIVMKDFSPYAFTGTGKIIGTLKNNKIFFFYSLIEEHDYSVFVKTLDENLSNERTVELGSIKETGYQNLGNFFVEYSPDNRLALLTLTNYCERKKAVGLNTEIFEDTEFIDYDMVSNQVEYRKRIPIDIDAYRQKTQQHKIDNDGNVAFISTLAEREDRYGYVRGISLGYSTSEKDQLAFSKINTEGMSSFSSGLYLLKNSDLVYAAVSKNKVKIKYVSVKNPSMNYEKEVNSSYLRDFKDDFQIEDLVETGDGFYLIFRKAGIMDYTGYISYSEDRFLPIAFFDKAGNYKWSKLLPVIKPLYRYYERRGVNAVFSNNKLHVFYTENKPYEITEKNQKLLDEDRTILAKDYKKHHTVEAIVDENQVITKQTIEDSTGFLVNPKEENMVLYEGNLYFVSDGKKVFKIKKVILN